ncbi:Zinc finger, CCHC-type [Phytophthora cactorum]|nr:Zinc finger, CCHC-type [Phytophthora cactorum]
MEQVGGSTRARHDLSSITQLNHLPVSKFRAFSTIDGPNDEDEEDKEELIRDEEDDEQKQPIYGEMSPLERLMQHSQQFQLDMDLDDDDDDDDNEQSDDSAQGNDDEEGHDPFASEWDLIDYETELENVWGEEQLKLRKFYQALHREEDKDHVCTNCGERGHRAMNCLIPRICSNCGNLGHTARQCRYRRNPDSVDEFLLEEEEFQQKRKKSQKFRKKAAKAANNPSMPRPKELPTSDLNKRNESLRKELDAELDAYADMLEEKDRKRKEDN